MLNTELTTHTPAGPDTAPTSPSQSALRVAVVTETYPPEINGVAMTVARLVNGLRAKHEVQVVRPRQAADTEQAPEDGSQTILTRGFPIPRYPELHMGLPAHSALKQQWKARKPDLIHIATEGPLGWSALRVARKLNIPTTSDFRTNFDLYSKHYGIGWLQRPIGSYLKRFHNATQCTMVPTAKLGAELTQRGFQNIKVVARGIDTALFNSARRSDALRAIWGVRTEQPVALYVGRIAPEKNLSLLIEAYHQMKAANPELRLVVVGSGPAQESLHQACPDAIFSGVQTGEALARHYASADIFVFPSLSETFGNVTLEALASGLACVAFDHAAASELVEHGANGLVAPCHRPDQFIEAASLLASNTAMRQSLRVRAEQSVASLDWARIVEGVEHGWLDILRAARHREGARRVKPDRSPVSTSASF